ncbi:hypothetical protein GCK72_009731 [Caenorhabditis remanei]|uniref:Uncharacterized protein n=1 Tax=Caenorhabditis remanei TaxID=31234 RepID=A0A6A5H3C4_CAERE|nr:hypothetical protein GCK72_009731 [Caenorhabditis remanei]KAF1761475.1 hypothetical protein GCK72_009731 [Caenorhabditis remanei]
MSSIPRSSLKKHSGIHDDRRVSFASPLSSDKGVAPLPKKRFQITKSSKVSHASVKKSKQSEELVDINSLANQQSEVLEEICEIENKFTKHSALTRDMTIELTNFIEIIANFSSDSTKVEARLEEQFMKLGSVEASIKDLVVQAQSVCTKFETRMTARSHYSTGLLELQKLFGSVNCKQIETMAETLVDYDTILAMVDQLEGFVGDF